MIIRPPFPSQITSSGLASWRACPRKWELEYLNHWKPGTTSIHLHAGKAFATGLEVTRRAFYERNADADAAIGEGVEALLAAYGDFEPPPMMAKTPTRMAGALVYYFDQYPLYRDIEHTRPYQWAPGKYAIEFSFASPLPASHPVTGEPLILAGRADMICEMAGGIFIEDDKTASSLGASWSSSFDMRGQFTAYAYAARQSGLNIDGVLIRGVSILKTKYETQQVITYRRGWEIDRWLAQTLRDIERMKASWLSGQFDYNLSDSCEAYGGCTFKRICMSNEPASWLENYYTRRKRDSLTLEETDVTPAELLTWQNPI